MVLRRMSLMFAIRLIVGLSGPFARDILRSSYNTASQADTSTFSSTSDLVVTDDRSLEARSGASGFVIGGTTSELVHVQRLTVFKLSLFIGRHLCDR